MKQAPEYIEENSLLGRQKSTQSLPLSYIMCYIN